MTRTRPVRVYNEVKSWMEDLKRKVSVKEGRDIRLPELTRRISKISLIEPTLLSDAELKRRLKK